MASGISELTDSAATAGAADDTPSELTGSAVPSGAAGAITFTRTCLPDSTAFDEFISLVASGISELTDAAATAGVADDTPSKLACSAAPSGAAGAITFTRTG